MEEFIAFLTKKKISAEDLQRADPERFVAQAAEFAQMGPKSYDQRRKFAFNDWRLRYPLSAGSPQQ